MRSELRSFPPAAHVAVVAAAIVVLLLAAAGCGGGGPTTSSAPAAPTTSAGAGGSGGSSTTAAQAGGEVVVMTHDSFAVSDAVLAAFTAQTGLEVKVLKSGDAGAMLNQAILAKDNPLADVMYGVDDTFLSRALDAGIFEPYESPGLKNVQASLQLDPQHRVAPIDIADVCVNYDKKAFAGAVKPPATLRDLTNPEYRGKLVVENPATSSPGLVFLLLTIAQFGETGEYTWQDYWKDLVKNDVLVDAGWEEAYYGSFSGGSGKGERPLVVSYSSSPVAEVVFSETPLKEAPTGVAPPVARTQIEFAGVLKGAKNPEGARKWVDFMLSKRFQEDMPLQMFVRPASDEAQMPPVYAQPGVAVGTLTYVSNDLVSYESIGKDRDRWIEEWTAIALP